MAGCWYVDPSSKRSWGLRNADRMDHMSLSEYDVGYYLTYTTDKKLTHPREKKRFKVSASCQPQSCW